tara:strand:+ start:532 stop:810 length:279 start_codon:yes stop_codon:yes gene_type:complete
MSTREQIMIKVNDYFDKVEEALKIKDYSSSQLYVAKLSKYFHIFDDELSDYYQYLVDTLDVLGYEIEILEEEPEKYYEPSELDEWHDFDPDC